MAPKEIFCPKTGKVLKRCIMQEPPPTWVRDGLKLRVKSTSQTRIATRGSHGLQVNIPSWGDRNDSAAWAGEECVVKLRVHPHKTQEEVDAGGCYYGGVPYVAGEGGDYQWVVEFDRGRTYFPYKSTDWNHFVLFRPK